MPRPANDLSDSDARRLARQQMRVDKLRERLEAEDALLRNEIYNLHRMGGGSMQSIANAIGRTKAWVHIIVSEAAAKQPKRRRKQ